MASLVHNFTNITDITGSIGSSVSLNVINEAKLELRALMVYYIMEYYLTIVRRS